MSLHDRRHARQGSSQIIMAPRTQAEAWTGVELMGDIAIWWWCVEDASYSVMCCAITGYTSPDSKGISESSLSLLQSKRVMGGRDTR